MKNLAKRIFVGLATVMASSAVYAQDASHGGMSEKGLVTLAAGLAIGLAAIGGALGQGKTASSALEGIARNPAAQPKIFTPMIVALALIESLVIYALVVAIMVLGKI